MAVFTTERTARKRHTCSDCGRNIAPGQRYALHTATPGDPDIGNTRWWRIRVHRDRKDCQ